MIAATNPFLGLSTPIMPIGLAQETDLQLVRLETYGGRIVEIPAALPASSLVQICGGSSWLTGQFPQYARQHGTQAIVVGFDQARAARALIEACCHAENVRRERKRA